MASIQVELKGEQAELAKAYALIKQEIKCLEDQAKLFKQEIDNMSSALDLDYETGIEYMVDNQLVLTISPSTYNYQFDCNMDEFLKETKRYDLFDISVTRARKLFSETQMRQYFKRVIGGRKCFVAPIRWDAQG